MVLAPFVMIALAPVLIFLRSAEAACLHDAIPAESRANLEAFDGQASVPFGIWTMSWDSGYVASYVLKILAEEVLGYSSTISGVGGDARSGLFAVAGCRAPEDLSDPQCSHSPFFVHHTSLEVWGLSNIASMREQLADMPDVIPEDAGDMGYQGIESIYVMGRERQEAYQREGLALEYFRSFDAAWQRPSAFFDNYTAFETAELKLCSETRLNSADRTQHYLQATGDDPGVVQNPDGTQRARCWNSSWWFSPACRSHPETCVPFVTVGNGWFAWDAMQKATAFNMPLAVAVARTFAGWKSNPRNKRCLTYWWQPDTSFVDLQPTILTFPPYNAAEREQNILFSMVDQDRLSKWVDRRLGLRASRLRELVLRLSITSRSMDEMLLAKKQRSNATHEEVVCNWLKRNRHVWSDWIPLKTKCVAGMGLVGGDGSFVEGRGNASGCAWCAPGRSSTMLNDAVGTTYRCVACQPGHSQQNPGQPECSPCSAGTFAGGYESRECQHCDFGEYNAGEGRARCDPCAPTFITNFRGATNIEACICPEGSYQDTDRRDVCSPCLEGMTCPEGSDALGYSLQPSTQSPVVPLLKPGFWSSREEPLDVFRCEDTNRCPGGTVPGSACKEHFELQACADCEDGYSYFGDQCVPCTSEVVQLLLFPFLFMAIMVVVVLMLYRFSGGDYKNWSSWYRGVGCAIFIVLNHYHVVNVLLGLESITTRSLSFFQQSVLAISDPLMLLRPRCSVLRSFMSRLILSSHSPGILLLVVFGVWLLSKLLGLCRPALRIDHDRLLNGYFSLILAFFTSVSSTSFAIFKCSDNPNGVHTLVLDRSVNCFQGEWNSMVGVGAMAVLFWCVGFGAVCLRAIYVASARFCSTAFRTRWEFLFIRYRPDVHWWSLTIVAKGVLLNLGVLFISGIGQILWVLAVLLLYMCLLFVWQPWRHLLNNSVDGFVHLCLFGTCTISVWVASYSVGITEQATLAFTLLKVSMALAVAPVIPVAIIMFWRDRSKKAQDRKDLDSRLIVNALSLMFQGTYDEQVAFLKTLTENDFQLMNATKNVLLLERGHIKARFGYSVSQVERMTKSSVRERSCRSSVANLFSSGDMFETQSDKDSSLEADELNNNEAAIGAATKDDAGETLDEDNPMFSV